MPIPTFIFPAAPPVSSSAIFALDVFADKPVFQPESASFTRATTATRINSSGLIETVDAGIARVDWSGSDAPNTLLEPQRTNLALYSQAFFPYWSTSPINTAQITTTTTIDPEGLTNAARVENVLSGQFGRTFTIVSGSTYTNSWWIRRVSGTGVVSITDVNGIDKNCTLTSQWQRFDTTTVSISTIGRAYVRVFATGDIVEVWGAQLEAGAFPTTYIPTTSTSVTRNTDVFNLSNVYTSGKITSAGGTWFVDFRNNRAYTGGITQAQLLGLGNNVLGATADNFWLACINTARIAIWKQVAGSISTLATTTTDTAKIAIKWNGSTADIFVNGVKVVSATAFTPTALESLRTINVQHPYYINSMALYPTPLSDTDCIELTTL
jgi:hypothetical protein